MIYKIIKQIKNFFTPKQIKELRNMLDSVPGPSPWWLETKGPKFLSKYGIVSWQDAGEKSPNTGKIVMKAGEKSLAIFDFNHYVMYLKDSLILVWNQKTSEKGLTNPITFFVFDCNFFTPIENIDKACEKMTDENIGIHHIDGLVYKIDVPTNRIDDSRIILPNNFFVMEELLVLVHSSAIGGFDWQKDNLCILSIRPKSGDCKFYPQDWFNYGKYDYGYQWVTKIARDPKTNKIIGEGIRIRNFILDKSNRKIAKYF